MGGERGEVRRFWGGTGEGEDVGGWKLEGWRGGEVGLFLLGFAIRMDVCRWVG